MIRANAMHYLMLRRVAAHAQADEHGSYFVDLDASAHEHDMRLLSVTGACIVTGLWSIPSGSVVYIIPKC